MSDTPLQKLKLTIDFLNYAGGNTGPLFVRKEALHAVRLSRPEEILDGCKAKSGETIQENHVVILPADAKTSGQPLYCMDQDAFLKNSIPQGQVAQPGEEPSLWLVEADTRRAFIVPEEHGPFHLDAPSAWGNHKGWDVDHVSEIVTPDGQALSGYLIVETDDGPMYDKAATEKGLYKISAPSVQPA